MPTENSKDFPLPPGVREQHGAWHLIRAHRWVKLCRVDEGPARLYERLRELGGPGGDGTVWNAILSYLQDGMGDLAESTRKHYRATGRRMLHHFGHHQLEEVEPTHCKQYLKWCRKNGRATTGNREKAFMSSVWEYALGEGWCSVNPWRGIKRNKERPSTAYVEHETLVAELDRAPPELYCIMGVAYLLGIRQTDLRLLRLEAWKGDELHIIESKTGKANTHQVTPTVRYLLQQAIDHREAAARVHEVAAARLKELSQYGRAEVRRSKAAGVRQQPFVFLSQRGLPWSEWGLQSALRRFKPAFRFRWLRPKAQTDRPDLDVLGHSGQMRGTYIRRRRLAAVK